VNLGSKKNPPQLNERMTDRSRNDPKMQPSLTPPPKVMSLNINNVQELTVRLGLCCLFVKQPIRFRTTTARAQSKLSLDKRIRKIRSLAANNAVALRAAIDYCALNGIGCFRVNSKILPLKTHPQHGYNTELLGEDIIEGFKRCGKQASQKNIRITFHPDQFVVLSSPNRQVVKNSISELEYQAEVAEWISADVINIHGGGGYGDKPSALKRFAESVGELSDRVRSRLTIENDDRTYTPSDLIPMCQKIGIPLVYDVHHHRCHGDGLDLNSATALAVKTWDREPLFHVSSPREGWQADNPRPHHDYIDTRDFPALWRGMNITVEVEAKAKELAVSKLRKELIQDMASKVEVHAK